MKPITGKRMCRLLEMRGWQLARINGSHHIYGKSNPNQRVTVPVHGSADLKPGTQRKYHATGGNSRFRSVKYGISSAYKSERIRTAFRRFRFTFSVGSASRARRA